MAIRIGISGWRYAPWRGVFYPDGLAQRRELEYASARFGSIELNGSFYSLQTPASYQAWHDATPDGFVFAVKGPRYLTHMLRLRGVETPLANFLASGVLRLGAKLGPMLWQLPAHFRFDAVRPLRHALEPRHESFGSRESLALLRKHGIALVVADSAGKFRRWARRGDVFYYFDNDAKVHAPFDAIALMRLLGLSESTARRPRHARGEDARDAWPAP